MWRVVRNQTMQCIPARQAGSRRLLADDVAAGLDWRVASPAGQAVRAPE